MVTQYDINSYIRKGDVFDTYPVRIAYRPFGDMFAEMKVKPELGGLCVLVPRQCGKTTYAVHLMILDPNIIYVGHSEATISQVKHRNGYIDPKRFVTCNNPRVGDYRFTGSASYIFDDVEEKQMEIMRGSLNPFLCLVTPRFSDRDWGKSFESHSCNKVMILPEDYIATKIRSRVYIPDEYFLLD